MNERGVTLIASDERQASTNSGYPMLLVALILIAAQIWLISRLARDIVEPSFLTVAPIILIPVAFLFVIVGFYMLQPNQAAVITLFGSYKGTDRKDGLRWVLPWLMRHKVSVRAHNFISDKIKVNDLRGNPIEMAAQIVWRVVDTAQATFDVDDFKEFVRVQVEAAIRTIGARYPYDDFATEDITLRGHIDEVGVELLAELEASRDAIGKIRHVAGDPKLAKGNEKNVGASKRLRLRRCRLFRA